MRKATTSLSHNGWSIGRNLNLGPAET